MSLLFFTCYFARVRPVEKNALWWLYEATAGTSWLENTNWNPNTDPCRKFSSPVPYRFDLPQTTPFQSGAQFDATPWFGVGCIDPCDDYLDGEACSAGRVTALKLRQVTCSHPSNTFDSRCSTSPAPPNTLKSICATLLLPPCRVS